MSESVLIIERDREVGETIKTMVEAMGCSATAVQSADAALTLLSRKRIDIVMTNCLYVSARRKISLAWLAKQVQPSVTVVLTASGEPVDLNALRALDGHLKKPFSVADLQRTMARLPERCKGLEERRHTRRPPRHHPAQVQAQLQEIMRPTRSSKSGMDTGLAKNRTPSGMVPASMGLAEMTSAGNPGSMLRN